MFLTTLALENQTLTAGGSILLILGALALAFWKTMAGDWLVSLFKKKKKKQTVKQVVQAHDLIQVTKDRWDIMNQKLQFVKEQLSKQKQKSNQLQQQVDTLKQQLTTQINRHSDFKNTVNKLLRRIDKSLQQKNIAEARLRISVFIDATEDSGNPGGSGIYKAIQKF